MNSQFNSSLVISNIFREISAESTISEMVEIVGTFIKVKDISIDLGRFQRVHLVGIGKAASFQLRSISKKLAGVKIPGLKIAITKRGHTVKGDREQFIEFESDHPYISNYSITQTEKFITRLAEIDESDLVIILISGGASALLAMPGPFFNREELIGINRELIGGGAGIVEINRVRKLISSVKNGGLLKFIRAKEILNLITSDIPGGGSSFVGSSPTIYSEDKKELINHSIKKSLKTSYCKEKLESYLFSVDREINESELRTVYSSKNIESVLLADEDELLRIAKREFSKTSRECFVIDTFSNLSFDSVVNEHLDFIRNKVKKGRPFIVVSGGEASVEVEGDGIGGRNTHFVAKMAYELFEKNWLELPVDGEGSLADIEIISVGTDGSDGDTTAAGAFMTYAKYLKGVEKGLDLLNYINGFDTYSYFLSVESLIETGPTGANLMDLRIFTL